MFAWSNKYAHLWIEVALVCGDGVIAQTSYMLSSWDSGRLLEMDMVSF